MQCVSQFETESVRVIHFRVEVLATDNIAVEPVIDSD